MAWYENRGTDCCFSFLVMTPVPTGSRSASHWPGLYNTLSGTTETSNGSKPLIYSNSEVAPRRRGLAPYITLAWLLLPNLPSLC